MTSRARASSHTAAPVETRQRYPSCNVRRRSLSSGSARLRSDLTQGALAEMRGLIFELRPEALTEEGIVAALDQQAAALSARSGLPIALDGPRSEERRVGKECGARGGA